MERLKIFNVFCLFADLIVMIYLALLKEKLVC